MGSFFCVSRFACNSARRIIGLPALKFRLFLSTLAFVLASASSTSSLLFGFSAMGSSSSFVSNSSRCISSTYWRSSDSRAARSLRRCSTCFTAPTICFAFASSLSCSFCASSSSHLTFSTRVDVSSSRERHRSTRASSSRTCARSLSLFFSFSLRTRLVRLLMARLLFSVSRLISGECGVRGCFWALMLSGDWESLRRGRAGGFSSFRLLGEWCLRLGGRLSSLNEGRLSSLDEGRFQLSSRDPC
mmetsp:Transcript_17689/g.29733  ORF Transcript_17689/g.29733 Transcript_17689/m.29733 type:complete len:245 (-) Transcript_17689:744-1478(-)